MQKKANSYKFSVAEQSVVKRILDKRYGKTTTPVDYGPPDEYGAGVEAAVYACTGQSLSGSTLERLVGLRSESRGVRKSTLNILATYLGYNSVEGFVKHIVQLSSVSSQICKQFKIDSLLKSHLVKIEFSAKRSLSIRYVSGNIFEVVDIKNTRFEIHDSLIIEQLEVDLSFECRNIERLKNGRRIGIGSYSSGSFNYVKTILLYK